MNYFVCNFFSRINHFIWNWFVWRFFPCFTWSRVKFPQFALEKKTTKIILYVFFLFRTVRKTRTNSNYLVRKKKWFLFSFTFFNYALIYTYQKSTRNFTLDMISLFLLLSSEPNWNRKQQTNTWCLHNTKKKKKHFNGNISTV